MKVKVAFGVGVVYVGFPLKFMFLFYSNQDNKADMEMHHWINRLLSVKLTPAFKFPSFPQCMLFS